METTIIKIFGGPGAGKSTLAAKIFAELKMNYDGSVEYVQEYAKSLVWQGKEHLLSNQPLVTNGQKNMLMPLVGKVDVIVTDSPLELGLFYANCKEYCNYVKKVSDECNQKFNSLNLFIKRGNFKFERQGRVHSLGQSIIIDEAIIKEIPVLHIVNHDMEIKDVLTAIDFKYHNTHSFSNSKKSKEKDLER